MSKAKNWCFTLNNYSLEEYESIKRVVFGNCRYGIIGEEVGEKGTPHLQFYLQFRSRVSLRQIKRLVGSRVHAEIARGSADANKTYCSKEGKFWEHGVMLSKGERSDIADVVDCFREGKTWEEVLETYPSQLARYPKFFDRCAMQFSIKRDWVPEVYVYWGGTGCGKSRRAFSEAQDPYVHSGGVWFDGYSGETDVIFDDFGGSEFKLTYLLKLLDRYPMRVPVKGSFVSWCPRKIWITSNYSPKDWYPNAKDEHVKALFRRITKSIQFRKLNEINDDIPEEVVVF